MSDATCAWTEVYRHDGNGVAQSGALGDLVAAIKVGADVQVRFYRSDPNFGRIEWHQTGFRTSIQPDRAGAGRQVVSLIAVGIPDTSFDAGNGRTISDRFAEEWHIYNTTGVRHKVTFSYATREVLDDNLDRMSLAWFVRGADTSLKFLNRAITDMITIALHPDDEP